MKFKTKNIGQRVQLKRDDCLGFKAGAVGTIKDADGEHYAVHFDVACDGWGSKSLGIPVLHGLYIHPKELRKVRE